MFTVASPRNVRAFGVEFGQSRFAMRGKAVGQVKNDWSGLGRSLIGKGGVINSDDAWVICRERQDSNFPQWLALYYHERNSAMIWGARD